MSRVWVSLYQWKRYVQNINGIIVCLFAAHKDLARQAIVHGCEMVARESSALIRLVIFLCIRNDSHQYDWNVNEDAGLVTEEWGNLPIACFDESGLMSRHGGLACRSGWYGRGNTYGIVQLLNIYAVCHTEVSTKALKGRDILSKGLGNHGIGGGDGW